MKGVFRNGTDLATYTAATDYLDGGEAIHAFDPAPFKTLFAALGEKLSPEQFLAKILFSTPR